MFQNLVKITSAWDAKRPYFPYYYFYGRENIFKNVFQNPLRFFNVFFYGFSVAKTCSEIMKMSVSCRRDAHFHKIAFFDFDSHFD